MTQYNKNSLDTVCRTLTDAMGIRAARFSKPHNKELDRYIKNALGNEKVDKIIMYNPDAIAEWIYRKYNDYFLPITEEGFIEVPLRSVMPSVTPVCFATMYTGTQPILHGIRKYEKPVLKMDSIFDAMIRAGKKPVIISEKNASMSMIYLDKKMDYFICDTVEEVNRTALELIRERSYDLYCIYNGNYDELMHKVSPEGERALEELRNNILAFQDIIGEVKNSLSDRNVLVGFAMDHGCHAIDGGAGSHGLKMPEDLNICHLYKIYKKNGQQ